MHSEQKIRQTSSIVYVCLVPARRVYVGVEQPVRRSSAASSSAWRTAQFAGSQKPGRYHCAANKLHSSAVDQYYSICYAMLSTLDY